MYKSWPHLHAGRIPGTTCVRNGNEANKLGAGAGAAAVDSVISQAIRHSQLPTWVGTMAARRAW